MSIILCEIPEDCESPEDDMGSMQIHLRRELSAAEYDAFENIAISSDHAGADYESEDFEGAWERAWINCDKDLLEPIRAFLNALS